MERVTRTVALGATFDAGAFERAFASFRRLYGTAPLRVTAAPDVLDRYARLFGRGSDEAHRRELRHDGVPLVAAILAPGTLVIEGEVDDVKMGDW